MESRPTVLVPAARVSEISRPGLVLLVVGWLSGFVAGHANEPSPGADFFTAHPVCRIQIELAPQGIESLRTESRRYVPAKILAPGGVFREVGVHLKGSSGSFRSIDANPSFTLDFARFIPGQKFCGLQKIHLNNSVEDPSSLNEQIGSELFRAAGVPTPRVAHALVELNGRPLGLYVLKEGFTEDFVRRHFERADGNLYDTDDGHDINLPMKRHLGRTLPDDQSELKRLATAALDPELDRRWERLQRTLDLDRFLAFMAMEIMIGHWDGYCLGRNNFRIYHDPGAEKIVFLPSGMDQLFGKADLPWKPGMAGLVARSLMEVPEGRQQYSAKFRSLFAALFHSERLTNRVNQLLAELRPFLKSGEFERKRQAAAELCGQITLRELDLRRQLSEPEPSFPAFVQDIAPLAGWKPVGEPVGGKMEDGDNLAGEPAFHIVAGPRTSASWRTIVRLEQGRYRLRGKARVNGVTSLPFGRNQGASLRVAGTTQRSASLIGSTGWEHLEIEFDISAPEAEIGLACELRAGAGEVWFDKGSLGLVRLR